MRFATKVFFCVLVLVLIGFDVMGYWLLQRSYQLNREYTIEASQTEFSVVSGSVQKSLAVSQEQFTEPNAENINIALAPYAEFYARQGVYFALYNNGELMYNGMPGDSTPPAFDQEAPQGSVNVAPTDGVLYLFIQKNLSEPNQGMKLVYVKDIQSLSAFQSDMAYTFAVLSVVVGLVLAVLLFIMLANLTKPFRTLNAAASEISQGKYERRVAVRGKDEVAQFAQSFNAMAESVEGHVQQLTEMADEKERYIADLSHELRTPVTAILGYAEVLQIGNCSDQERDQAVAYLMEQSKRLKGLSAKLMDLTSMEHAALEHAPISLESVFTQVENTLGYQLEEKSIAFKRDSIAAVVWGDAALIESLFQNLIENAIRASHEDGLIELRVDESDECVAVSVVDHGDGMEASEIEKVTEPFYRVDKARSRAYGGAGLGLTLCARICAMQNAHMEIVSQRGEGTEIRIDFTTQRHVHDDSATAPQ